MPSEITSPPIIFAFHKVRRGRRWDHTNIQPSRLCRILEAVVSSGYVFDSVSHAIASSDSKNISATFDDGYAHLAETLPDLCRQVSLRPTLFIPAGVVGKSNIWDYSSLLSAEPHLTAAEIRKLSDSGVDIGSHGWSHRALTSLRVEQVRGELSDSKKLLEDITGRAINAVSYPFGRTNTSITRIATEVGYRYGLTTAWPTEAQSPMTVGRIMIYAFDTPASVLRKLHGRLQWLEHCKQSVATSLATGTGVYQRLFRRG